jgi:penicillin amidase
MLPADGAPVSRPVEILWNDHQVPFIEAETDADLATALGIAHAHLRGGQMELMRRIAQGRVSEITGGFGLAIDRLIHTFDIGRAVPAIIADMPAETRSWLENFARGINHCLAQALERPREFALLKLQPEPWSIADLVTLGRLVAADVNWIVWMRLLKYRNDADWPSFWQRLLRHDLLSFESGSQTEHMRLSPEHLATLALRSGSNSTAVAGAKSESGGALIANDPHLPITMPNVWLLCGMKSPSHHAVGLMVPGVPFIAIGRNPWIAWGGASLHAASSDLVAVPLDAPLRERGETIRVRGEGEVILLIRESEWGPIVSDLPAFRSQGQRLALRWMGHQPSDEFTAMLRVGRARNWEEFRAAYASYAVPGLEMNYADTSGHIGQLMAAKLPRRRNAEPADVLSPPENGWDALMDAEELPSRFKPPEGFLASANARPDRPAPVIAFHYSPQNRVTRLRHLLGGRDKLSVAALRRIQRDVHLEAAVRERDRLLAWLDEMTGEAGGTARLLQALRTWDGNYDAQSEGALAFELLFFHFARALVAPARHAAYEAVWGTRALIWEDILNAPTGTRQQALGRAASQAARDFRRGRNWGALHRLQLTHPFGLIPILGRTFHFADVPASGTSESLMKTAHGLTNRRHRTSYGSVARHISDLSDPDENYFVLLGGQDGWFGSDTLADQLALWQRGEYIRLPLQPENARKTFLHCTMLKP